MNKKSVAYQIEITEYEYTNLDFIVFELSFLVWLRLDHNKDQIG